MQFNHLRISLLSCFILALFLIPLADAGSSSYTLRTAGKDKQTDQFLQATITVNGTAKTGTPWADFTIPSNADIITTHAHAGYHTDTDVYFFDSELPSCISTPSCTIENNGYATQCTNNSDTDTTRYRCSTTKNNVAFYFTYYPANNGVLTTNHLSSSANAPPEIRSIGPNATNGTAPMSVRFEPSIVLYNKSDLSSVRWVFGDGTPESNEYNATHTFNTTGTFTVNLTIFDSNGLTASKSTTITVSAQEEAPPATKSSSENLGGSGGGGGGGSSVGRDYTVGTVKKDVVTFPAKTSAKKTTNEKNLGTSETVDILDVHLPEMHVGQPALVTILLDSREETDVIVTFSVRTSGTESQVETKTIRLTGRQTVDFDFLPVEDGEHAFRVVVKADDGTEAWNGTAVVLPEIIEQNIVTGVSLRDFARPLYIAILVSAIAIIAVVWKRDEIRKYLGM